MDYKGNSNFMIQLESTKVDNAMETVINRLNRELGREDITANLLLGALDEYNSLHSN